MRLVKSRFSGTRKVSKTKKTGCLAGLHFFAQCFDCVKYLGFRFAGVKKAVMINQRCDTVLSSRITLNATGSRLLATHHTLKVELAVTAAGKSAGSRVVTFKSLSKANRKK